MIRRFNSTGRVSIPRTHANVTLRRLESGGPRGGGTPDGGTSGGGASGDGDAQWCFDLKLDLDRFGFPDDARVRVEAWRSSASQRWDWGTIGALDPPDESGRLLVDVPETCQFRVSVIAAGDSGLLLGLADKLRPRLPVESLLPLVPADLGGEVWRLDYGQGDDLVVLKVADGLPDFSGTVRGDPVFRGLVMPQVLRSILERALLVEREDPSDREGRWSPWFNLSRDILPTRDPPVVGFDAQDDQIARADQWIDEVVAAFSAQRVRALDGCRKAWQGK